MQVTNISNFELLKRLIHPKASTAHPPKVRAMVSAIESQEYSYCLVSSTDWERFMALEPVPLVRSLLGC